MYLSDLVPIVTDPAFQLVMAILVVVALANAPEGPMKPKEYKFDLQSELDRKMMEAAAELERNYSNGEISDEAYQVGLLALNTASRGIVDPAINEWIDAERTVVSLRAPSDTRVLHKGTTLLALSREVSGAVVKVVKVKNGQLSEDLITNDDQISESAAAKDIINKLERKALAIGMRRLA